MAQKVHERRKHLRLALRFPAIFSVLGMSWSAQTRNISFGGVFLELSPSPQVTPGDACRVQITLAQGLRIEVSAAVCRIEAEGLSVRFLSTDLASYEHFKAVMVFNCADPDRLLEELAEHPGLTVLSPDVCAGQESF